MLAYFSTVFSIPQGSPNINFKIIQKAAPLYMVFWFMSDQLRVHGVKFLVFKWLQTWVVLF